MCRKLRSIERYDTQQDTWKIVTNMPGAGRLGPAVTAYKGMVYIVGGYNKDDVNSPMIGSVDCYNPLVDTYVQPVDHAA